MDIREDAHRLLDELDDDQVATAAELLRDLVRQPLEDEPEALSEAPQEYPQPHEDERQRAVPVEDSAALLLSGDLDHPDRYSAWH